MSFKIVRNDITKVCADAIVNTANPMPLVGSGTDAAVYEAAGREKLLAARKEIGVIERGQSAWTPAFNLKKHGVKYIIHTIGVFYRDGSHGEKDILRSCYRTALELVAELGCKSVALPLLASGNYRFPKDIALQIAVEEISRFLLEHEIDVFLVVYDAESYKISEKLFDDVEDFLFDNLDGYEGEEPAREDFSDAHVTVTGAPASAVRLFDESELRRPIKASSAVSFEPQSDDKKEITPIDVDAFIRISKDRLNFQNTLMQLIADRKLDNASVYKKACIDKKFFSKIISNKDYVPKKHTVMALGLALELPLAEYEAFLASAGYAFMPSSKFDMIVKFCVINQIYNLIRVDVILYDHGEKCFAPS
ncbi:macro domain-containing protein [Treponema sp.]|uniref:macro domain-containing protein n=1 Tax=Treponema sp. TaxID=166 RepID=UPI0025CFF0C0|nr:macro domain-containing protein [Treponema sp.]MBR4321960.1 macro domain-containing protein [Treponema sp.]